MGENVQQDRRARRSVREVLASLLDRFAAIMRGEIDPRDTDTPASIVAAVNSFSDEQRLDALRRFSEHQVARLEKLQGLAGEQALRVSMWLAAGLLAINGAGALGVLDHSATVSSPRWAATCFFAGILLALMNGVWIQGCITRMSVPMERLIAYWRAVAITGSYQPEEEERFNAPIRRFEKIAMVAPLFGWLSGLMFVAGGSFAVASLPAPPAVPAAAVHSVDEARPNPDLKSAARPAVRSSPRPQHR